MVLSLEMIIFSFVPAKATTPPTVFKDTNSNISTHIKVTPSATDRKPSTSVLLAQTNATEIPNTVIIPGKRIYENDPNTSSENSITTQQINPRLFSTPDVIVNANPISITLYDNGDPDGDAVAVSVNRTFQPGLDNVLLTNVGQTFFINLEPGINRINVTALNEGNSSPNTASLVIASNQVVSGNNVLDANQSAGNTTSFTVGFPLITVSALAYPESALHILQAQAIGYPRILTIDRGPNNANPDRRRRASLRNYRKRGGRPAGPGQELDEYPQALFLENGGNADVRPISLSDNRGSGASVGNQCRPYPDGTKVELAVTPL